MLDFTITIGNLIAAASILISALGLLVAWTKDRKLRQQEYADRIRKSAGLVVARVDRLRQILLHFFDDLQPITTDADIMLVETQDVVKVRDFYWRELVAAHAKTMKTVMDEQIEIAYADMYGYDPQIHELFSSSVGMLKSIDECAFSLALGATQQAIIESGEKERTHVSAELGNLLRSSCEEVQSWATNQMERVVKGFQDEMVKLIQAEDTEITRKDVLLRTAGEVLPAVESMAPPPKVTGKCGATGLTKGEVLAICGEKRWGDTEIRQYFSQYHENREREDPSVVRILVESGGPEDKTIGAGQGK